jgi:quinol monooxygenase YgiN
MIYALYTKQNQKVPSRLFECWDDADAWQNSREADVTERYELRPLLEKDMDMLLDAWTKGQATLLGKV